MDEQTTAPSNQDLARDRTDLAWSNLRLFAGTPECQ
jgi:hypothetical protein